MKKNTLVLLVIIWAAVIAASYLWNYSLIVSSNTKIVYSKSKAFFEQILITRLWNSHNGGVYVPITAENRPNPYLNDSLRDIVSIEGLKLTKINPAYMTRQIAEINQKSNGIQFHITSLKPIRPANKADNWETKVLGQFEKGATESLELVKEDNILQYRYMAPLIVQGSCLKCHSGQGYKLSEIRGGISVSFPAALYLNMVKDELYSFAIIHLLIFLLGLIGIFVFFKMTNDYFAIIESKNVELMGLNATKDKFFSIIGHDLKNPFQSIIGFSELLEEQIKEKDYNGIEEYAAIIKNSSQRAMALLGNLLEWSSSQTGRMKFSPENFDIVPLIDEIVVFLEDSAHKKAIAISKGVPENASVFADKAMIGTILRNLVSNAIKFTHPEGHITISINQTQKDLTISVIDNGVGIKEEDRENLFRIDKNHSTKGTRAEMGTGLGLLLCKEFIEKHNGIIVVESEVGKGSIFSFTLPK